MNGLERIDRMVLRRTMTLPDVEVVAVNDRVRLGDLASLRKYDAIFVTIGLEHSIANMFFLPYALVLQGFGDTSFIVGALGNLVAVTLGNLVGGTVLVAGVYWCAYLRPQRGTTGVW